jgi:hypothetical protein
MRVKYGAVNLKIYGDPKFSDVWSRDGRGIRLDRNNLKKLGDGCVHVRD